MALPYAFRKNVEDFTLQHQGLLIFSRTLGLLLSRNASVYFPGRPEFENSTSKWNAYQEHNVLAVVEPGDDQDVAIETFFL